MTVEIKKPANAKGPKPSVKGSPSSIKPLEPGAAKTKMPLNVNLSVDLKTAIHVESVTRGISMTKLIGEMWEAYLEKRQD